MELFALSSSSASAMVVCFTTAYAILLFSLYRLPVIITGKPNRLGQLCRRTLQSFLFSVVASIFLLLFLVVINARTFFSFYLS